MYLLNRIKAMYLFALCNLTKKSSNLVDVFDNCTKVKAVHSALGAVQTERSIN